MTAIAAGQYWECDRWTTVPLDGDGGRWSCPVLLVLGVDGGPRCGARAAGGFGGVGEVGGCNAVLAAASAAFLH